MFSHNQIFSVSCTEEQLKLVLELIFKMDGISPNNLCYQIANDGRIILGVYSKKEDLKNWNKFIFDNPSMELIIEVIKQAVREGKTKDPQFFDDPDASDYWEGLYEDGYFIKAINHNLSDEKNGIKDSWQSVVSIEHFVCYYGK